MILTKNQVDNVLSMANAFHNGGMVSSRIGMGSGVVVFFTSFPALIRITKTGSPEENYPLIEDMRLAYVDVL